MALVRLTLRWQLISMALLAGACSLEASGPSSGEPAPGPLASFGEELGTGDLTVLMVVDRSGSMAQSWEGGPKWQAAQTALDLALEGVETTLTIGALLFPLGGDCEVPPLSDPEQIQFQRGDSFRERWMASPVSRPSGGTPLGEAFRQAHGAVLHAEEIGLLEQRFRVVVITDGEPTCKEDPEEAVALADQWRGMGVEVRVMGLPGSARAAALLNRIAGVEVFEDPSTGETVIPEAGSSWEEGDAAAPGYIAPPSSDEVDGSLHAVVR